MATRIGCKFRGTLVFYYPRNRCAIFVNNIQTRFQFSRGTSARLILHPATPSLEKLGKMVINTKSKLLWYLSIFTGPSWGIMPLVVLCSNINLLWEANCPKRWKYFLIEHLYFIISDKVNLTKNACSKMDVKQCNSIKLYNAIAKLLFEKLNDSWYQVIKLNRGNISRRLITVMS